MIAGRSVLGLAAALFIACTQSSAAENVLRFMGADATAATMDPHAYSDKDNKGATKQVTRPCSMSIPTWRSWRNSP
jgi:hypothetical protein